MLKAEGRNWIAQLRVKWVTFYFIRTIILVSAIVLVLAAISEYVFHFSPWLLAIAFPLLLVIFFYVNPTWKITNQDIARFINNRYPELEESADLLLKDQAELSLLQQLQSIKITQILPVLPQPKEPAKKLYTAIAFLLTAVIVSYGISKIPQQRQIGTEAETFQQVPLIKENIPAAIANFNITLVPPPYTQKPARTQQTFTIKAEAGSKIKWALTTNTSIKKLRLIFNDKEIIPLKPGDKTNTSWNYERTIDKAGFYQLELDGKKSDLYQIEVIPDLPVIVKIIQPKPHSTIDIGQPQKVNLKVTLNDDYGINDAFISATMASGKGEGVSFTEKKLSFNTNFGHKKSLTLNKIIDLKRLGMKPGDELYFFIKALDNHGQSSRSDVYFVSIVDTAELMSMAGMTNGVNLVPEYFRSERQIIIDTEKLIKEQGTISTDVFKTRSNDLGIDQKLLRLRYGQFLGEENETEIGGDHDDHDEHADHKGEEAKFGDVTAIVDKYAHKHDIAEDATFFEPEMKAQLKAVLTEMWNAELRLRTYKPQEALPYEYKALRLLKDLQQKSRAYVAKTTVKIAALKPEKRLSGELDKITQPVQKMTFEQKEQRTAQLKTTLAILENRKTGQRLTETDKLLLNETEKYMIGSAADHPATYLTALGSLRHLSTSNKVNLKDIDLVEQAIQKMLKDEIPKPQQADTPAAASLYKNYFNNLNKTDK